MTTPVLARRWRRRTRRLKVTVPKVANIRMIATDRPMSPTRLTMNAFLAAVAARGL